MVRFVVEADGLVGARQATVGAQVTVMDAETLGLGMGVDVGALALGRGFLGDDRDATLRPDNVFHEKRHLAHHRTPTGFVPPDRPVIERYLEMTVIDFPLGQLVGQPRAETGHADRPRPGHLAHHVDVMHPAIDDRRDGRHQVLVGDPFGPGRLLVEIHPHHQRFTELAGLVDERDPGRVITEDVAGHQLAVLGAGQGDQVLGRRHAVGNRFLGEHVTAGLERGPRVRRVGVRVRGDTDRVRPGLRQRGDEVAVLGVGPAELAVQRRARGR